MFIYTYRPADATARHDPEPDLPPDFAPDLCPILARHWFGHRYGHALDQGDFIDRRPHEQSRGLPHFKFRPGSTQPGRSTGRA